MQSDFMRQENANHVQKYVSELQQGENSPILLTEKRQHNEFQQMPNTVSDTDP